MFLKITNIDIFNMCSLTCYFFPFILFDQFNIFVYFYHHLIN